MNLTAAEVVTSTSDDLYNNKKQGTPTPPNTPPAPYLFTWAYPVGRHKRRSVFDWANPLGTARLLSLEYPTELDSQRLVHPPIFGWTEEPRTVYFSLIDLGHSQQIYSVKLHLRVGRDIVTEGDMIVSISNNSQIYPQWKHHLNGRCDLLSKYVDQSPMFVCDSSARYVRVNHNKPISTSEIEVYAGERPVDCTVLYLFVTISL